MTPQAIRNALALEQAKISIIAAAIGSCTCHCKSPNAAFHSADCRYLKLMHALDCLDDAMQTTQGNTQ